MRAAALRALRALFALAALCALPGLAPGAGAEPRISTLGEVGPALTRCWRAPDGLEGHEVTLRFSLRRDGTLIGAPRITYSRLPGDDADARRFVASVLAAVAACLPVAVTDELGAAIAGRPLTIRFLATRASPARARAAPSDRALPSPRFPATLRPCAPFCSPP